MNNMKIGILSIFVAIIGICFALWYNFKMVEEFESAILEFQNNYHLKPKLQTINKTNEITAYTLALLGIALGIKSNQNKNSFATIGITLSAILLILTMLPIWTYIIGL